MSQGWQQQQQQVPFDADEVNGSSFFVDGSGSSQPSDELMNEISRWMSSCEGSEVKPTVDDSVMDVPIVIAPPDYDASLPQLEFDGLQFGNPTSHYQAQVARQGTALMLDMNYTEPNDTYISGSPFSTTSESFNGSSPSSLLPTALSYFHLAPPPTAHTHGRRRSCSDPRSGGRDVPPPANAAINPLALYQPFGSDPSVPTTTTVAIPPISLPSFQGRPRANTGDRFNVDTSFVRDTSFERYTTLLHVPNASSLDSPNVQSRQRSRSASRSSHRATPYSSVSSSPSLTRDICLPFLDLSLQGSPTTSRQNESPLRRVSSLKTQVTTPAVRAASLARRTKPANFSCPHEGCGSTFTRRNNLVGHLRSHANERPFECDAPGCNSTFARSTDLSRHKRIHDKNGGSVVT